MDAKINNVNVFPLVKYYIDQLELYSTFQNYIPKNRSLVEPAEALCIMITNIIVAPKPLYLLKEWLSDYTDSYDGSEILADHFNDDCLGRKLDKLYSAPRDMMMTEISLRAIALHELDTSKIHNDSTSVTFSGAYNDQDPDTVQLKTGYNKDHRPDCKQIVFGLNITQLLTQPIRNRFRFQERWLFPFSDEYKRFKCK